jgi:hypothetical protein
MAATYPVLLRRMPLRIGFCEPCRENARVAGWAIARADARKRQLIFATLAAAAARKKLSEIVALSPPSLACQPKRERSHEAARQHNENSTS